jgi:hypothetical protein
MLSWYEERKGIQAIHGDKEQEGGLDSLPGLHWVS